MELQKIRYFLALAKELHFWNTSEKMFITQSALSRQIKALEQELGVQLFERDKRNVRLTAAGLFLQERWQILLPEIDNIHYYARQIEQGDEGSLRVAHPGSITHSVLPNLIRLLVQKTPKVQIELIEMMTQDLDKALLNYNVDIGFRREISQNKLLETRELYAEHFAIVLPENHPTTHENFEGLSSLRNEKFILPSFKNHTRYMESLRGAFSASGYLPEPSIVSEFGTTIMRLVADGMGISVLPISYSYSQPYGVRFIEIPHTSFLFMQWRKADNNPVLHKFLEQVAAYDFPKPLVILNSPV